MRQKYRSFNIYVYNFVALNFKVIIYCLSFILCFLKSNLVSSLSKQNLEVLLLIM